MIMAPTQKMAKAKRTGHREIPPVLERPLEAPGLVAPPGPAVVVGLVGDVDESLERGEADGAGVVPGVALDDGVALGLPLGVA
jgi:hypothetical protein